MVTDLQAIIGFEGLGINAWLVWILPFVGASLMPAIAKGGKRVRDYAAVGFALASAISALTLLPLGLDKSNSRRVTTSGPMPTCSCSSALVPSSKRYPPSTPILSNLAAISLCAMKL